jgi:hypothetical protein
MWPVHHAGAVRGRRAERDCHELTERGRRCGAGIWSAGRGAWCGRHRRFIRLHARVQVTPNADIDARGVATPPLNNVPYGAAATYLVLLAAAAGCSGGDTSGYDPGGGGPSTSGSSGGSHVGASSVGTSSSTLPASSSRSASASAGQGSSGGTTSNTRGSSSGAQSGDASSNAGSTMASSGAETLAVRANSRSSSLPRLM